MKHQWLAYVIVGLLSICAGVAIAGLPDNVPVEATIVPPTSMVAAGATVPETAVGQTTVPATTERETTVPTSTVSPTTTVSNASEPPDTTDPDATESVPADLVERGEVSVTAANGANIAGAALRMKTRLEGIGYIGVRPVNGTDIVEFTTVYFADGFDAAAARLAADLELLDVFVVPIQSAPTVADLPPDTELLVYIGLDRA